METIADLNLLRALDALLAEESVTRAAARLGTTTPSMSRTLARLRVAIGDPLFVRAGQRLVPTPHAQSLRERARAAVLEASALLRRPRGVPLSEMERTLTIRASDGVLTLFGAELLAARRAEVPRARLRFVDEAEAQAAPLRDGQVDLEVGEVALSAPELRLQVLLRDRYVGVVRKGHALLRGPRTRARFEAAEHVVAASPRRYPGPLDQELFALGLGRPVEVVVPSFREALGLAASTELVAVAPRLVAESHASVLALQTFELPFEMPEVVVAQAWSPRSDADPVHRWLRERIHRLASRLQSSRKASPVRAEPRGRGR